MTRQASDAVQLGKCLAVLAGVPTVTIGIVQNWCSATFRGHRVECSLILNGVDQHSDAERLKIALPDHAFDLPRQIVADILVTAIISQADGGIMVKIEALLLDD